MPVASEPAWRVERHGQDALVTLCGDWLVHESGLRVVEELRHIVAEIGDSSRLAFDTHGLGRWDSDLVAFVWCLQRSATVAGRQLALDESGLPAALRRLLALARADHGERFVELPADGGGPVRRTGAWVLGQWDGLVAAAEILGATVSSIVPLLRGRARMRGVDVVVLMRECGADALGIITVVNCLVGAILAFVGAVQLQRFGAGIYIANLVGIAVIREMAPIMTAIVMAGRTGGAFAAQIATMQGNEEIDALQVLGISPFQYLVLPRITALMAMLPVLYFYACLVGLAGGFAVAITVLRLSPVTFLNHLSSAVPAGEFYLGLVKSTCFGAFIALSSCLTGLRAGRSAAEVGNAATNSVVIGIIGVIALDAVFAACANVLGL